MLVTKDSPTTGDLTFTIQPGRSADVSVSRVDGSVNLCSVVLSVDDGSPPTRFSSCPESPPAGAILLPHGIAATCSLANTGAVDRTVALSPRIRHHPCNHDPNHLGVDPFESVENLGEVLDEDGVITSSWRLDGSYATIEIVVVLRDSGGQIV